MRSTGQPQRGRYYPPGEIERLCEVDLRHAGFLPEHPEAIRIDRYLEKRWAVDLDFAPLPDGVLGMTVFEAGRPVEVVVAKTLVDDTTRPGERRLRSTLAHEAGHCLLHAEIWPQLAGGATPLFADLSEPARPRFVCRESTVGAEGKKYRGEWAEWQANAAIGGFLLPTSLVTVAVEPFTRPEGLLGTPSLDWTRADDAARALADVFDVNPVVAKIRLDALFGATKRGQQKL